MMNRTGTLKTFASYIALSAIGLTATANVSGIMYNPPKAFMKDMSDIDLRTKTDMPIEFDMSRKSNYEEAMELFSGRMRDFTKEEAINYEKSLDEIYKPIGVNVFDLC